MLSFLKTVSLAGATFRQGAQGRTLMPCSKKGIILLEEINPEIQKNNLFNKLIGVNMKQQIFILIVLFMLPFAIFAQTLPSLPLDFESGTVNYTFTDFDGGVATKIANPQINGINTSANVARMIKGPGGQVWGGSWIGLSAPIDFSVNKTFKVKVFMPRVGAKLLLKVENQDNGGISFEKEATGTVANAWEELTFDYSTINTANQYQKLVFIFDLGTVGTGGADYTFLFDDIRLISTAPPPPDTTQMNLPVTFELPWVIYGLAGFGGAENSTIVVDPTLPSNHVAKVIRSAGSETWAGTTITAINGGTQTGFRTQIPFTALEKRMNVRVWSPHSGIQIRLKVEDFSDPTKSVETEVTNTLANAWETLVFDFGNQATGTAPINLSYYYNKASIFFNFGVPGSVAGERTYYFDDVYFGGYVIPVELIGFTANVISNNVSLTWATATETSNHGFEVYRDGSKIAFVEGNGTTTEAKSYSYSDNNVANGTYVYELRQIDFNGTVNNSASAEVVVNYTPEGYALFTNYPNPFNPSTTISYQIPVSGYVTLKIFDVIGNEVATLVNEVQGAGMHTFSFDASTLTSGVYFYTIKSGTFSATKKLVLMK